ncbi:MAG: helix-turn-helix domain-containing protein [Phycisphaerales bacterium]|nr:helix-turn-helix domain-containing protein [Phycisphaerales bacterium]
MAKMFYTVEEVCSKLGKTQEEVQEMVTSGQIQEFRDGDKLIFKVEQIDLLTESDDSGEIELDLSKHGGGGSASGLSMGSSEGSGLDLTLPGESGIGTPMDLTGSATGMPPAGASGTGSGLAFDLSGSATGVSAFGGGAGAEDAGETRLGEEFEDDLTLESVGSGSGLLDLTRESDDTSLGAELLEEVYSGEDEFELPANASGLFEAVKAEPGDAQAAPVAAGAPAAAMMMVEEAYDGSGSGLAIGLSIGALVAMVALLVVLASEFTGGTSILTEAIAGNLWIWTGGLAAGAIIAGGIGIFIGRASE